MSVADVFASDHGDVNSFAVAFVFGVFNSAYENINLVLAIDAIIIRGIAIGGEHAFFVPVAERERGNPEEARCFFYTQIFLFHKAMESEK